jgi:hypothetical protein
VGLRRVSSDVGSCVSTWFDMEIVPIDASDLL